jgi:hypothetical protein
MTLPGFENTTFWFLVQRFNHLRHSVPPEFMAKYKNNFMVSRSKIHRNFLSLPKETILCS